MASRTPSSLPHRAEGFFYDAILDHMKAIVVALLLFVGLLILNAFFS